MKNYILNKSINLIESVFPNYTQTELIKIRYGLEGIYITITKTIVIFSIAIFLNIFQKLLILVLIYNLLRAFSFGLHANNSSNCLIASTIIFIGATYVCQFINTPLFIKIIVSAISIITFIKYSPADTKKRPIINQKKRLKYKLFSTLIIIIYTFILFLSKHNFLNNTILLSMIFQSFLISPLCYSLFKQTYNNFLYWEGGIRCAK